MGVPLIARSRSAGPAQVGTLPDLTTVPFLVEAKAISGFMNAGMETS